MVWGGRLVRPPHVCARVPTFLRVAGQAKKHLEVAELVTCSATSPLRSFAGPRAALGLHDD